VSISLSVAGNVASVAASTTNGLVLSERAARALEEFGLRDLATPPQPPAVAQDEATSLALRAHVLALRANYFLARNRVKRAYGELREAAKICPDNYGIRLSLAKIESRALNNRRALQTCDELIRQQPERIEAYELKGQILEANGKVDQATAVYSEALKRWPNCDALVQHLVKLALAQRDYDLAIATCKRRLEREPRHFQTLWFLAYAYRLKAAETNDQDLYRESARYFEAALESQPRATTLYPRLSKIYEENLDQRDKALATLRRGLVADPSDREMRGAFEQLVSPEGDKEKILAAYRKLADEYPMSADIQDLYGSQLLAHERLHEARSQYERLLELQPNSVQTLLTLGRIDLQLDEADRAQSRFEHAARLAGYDVGTYEKIGTAYLSARLYDQAVQFFEKALARDPQRMTAYFALGQAYQEMRELDKATEVVKRGLEVIEQATSRKPLLLALSTVQQQRKEYGEAVATLRQAYELDRTDMLVFFRLANLLLTVDEESAFAELVTEGRRTFHNSPDVFQEMLAEILMDFHRYAEAIREIEELKKRQPDRWQYYARLATAYQRLRQTLNGESLYEEAHERLGESPEFYRFASRYHVLHYEHQEAYEALLRLLESTEIPKTKQLAEPRFALYGSLFYNLGRLKKYDEIAQLLERAEREIGNLDAKEMQMLRAQALGEMKRYDEAIALYRATIEGDPDNASLYYELGAVLNEAKRIEEAEKALRKCLELLPKVPLTPENRDLRATVLNHLGYMLTEERIKLEEAGQLLSEALDLQPRAGFIVDSMGWLQFKLGHFDKAVRLLEKALAYSSEDPIIYDHLGDAYAQSGDTKKAVEYWRKALALDPNLDTIKAKIVNLSEDQP